METKHETTNTDFESTLKSVSAALKSFFPASSLMTSFPPLAFHMMITFYALLIAVAIAKGPDGQSPSLMAFILLWHFCAIPAWILRSLTLKLCKTPLRDFFWKNNPFQIRCAKVKGVIHGSACRSFD